MIIDLILDRKDGVEYNAKRFYEDCKNYESYNLGTNGSISDAMDYGEESDVKRELCFYIDDNGYNPEIKDYINSVNWL
nr:hypothetical protein [uncultured Prevotella sp.]